MGRLNCLEENLPHWHLDRHMSHVDWWGAGANLCLRRTLVIILSFPIFTFICCQCCIVCIMTGSPNIQQTIRTNDLAGYILASPDIVTFHLQSVQKALIVGFCNVTEIVWVIRTSIVYEPVASIVRVGTILS